MTSVGLAHASSRSVDQCKSARTAPRGYSTMRVDVLLEDVGNFVQGERDRSDQTHVDFVKSPFLSKP